MSAPMNKCNIHSHGGCVCNFSHSNQPIEILRLTTSVNSLNAFLWYCTNGSFISFVSKIKVVKSSKLYFCCFTLSAPCSSIISVSSVNMNWDATREEIGLINVKTPFQKSFSLVHLFKSCIIYLKSGWIQAKAFKAV